MAFMPAVIVAAGIAVLSLAEASQMPSVQLNDKLVHGAMYLCLSIALMSGFMYIKRTQKSFYVLTCVLTTLYGALMELLQHLCTRTRSADIIDLLADLFGALIGVLLMVVITKLRNDVITKK